MAPVAATPIVSRVDDPPGSSQARPKPIPDANVLESLVKTFTEEQKRLFAATPLGRKLPSTNSRAIPAESSITHPPETPASPAPPKMDRTQASQMAPAAAPPTVSSSEVLPGSSSQDTPRNIPDAQLLKSLAKTFSDFQKRLFAETPLGKRMPLTNSPVKPVVESKLPVPRQITIHVTPAKPSTPLPSTNPPATPTAELPLPAPQPPSTVSLAAPAAITPIQSLQETPIRALTESLKEDEKPKVDDIHFNFWIGETVSDVCPICSQTVEKNSTRSAHYQQFHYDVFYSQIKMSDVVERWLGEKLGTRHATDRTCLHCTKEQKNRPLYRGRIDLLKHIKSDHPDACRELEKGYKEVTIGADVKGDPTHRMLLESSTEPSSAVEKKRGRGRPPKVPLPSSSAEVPRAQTASTASVTNTVSPVKDEDEANERRRSKRLRTGSVLEPVVAPRVREKESVGPSSSKKSKAQDLPVMSIKEEDEANEPRRSSRLRAGPNCESVMARKVRDKLRNKYGGEYGMALDDPVWLKDEDAVKFAEWMDYWESDEGKARGGPPKSMSLFFN